MDARHKAGHDEFRAWHPYRNPHNPRHLYQLAAKHRRRTERGLPQHDRRPLVQERRDSIASPSAPIWMPMATASATSRGCCAGWIICTGSAVTAIWLMPFQPSPGKDDGYDISDYYGVDPRYGTLGDFVEFTHGCRQRGIRVIIDLVVNHTSDAHPWFRDARSSPDSHYRDWYVWADKKPANASTGMVFPGVQKSTWTHDKEAGAWYFHRFYDFQPDLNTSNPHVQAEILKIMGFWIQLGVSGFRMDAVPFVIATKGAKVQQAGRAIRHAALVPRISAMAARQRHHPRRSQRAARNRHGIFRPRRRPHAHDVQFPRQPAFVLCAGVRRLRPLAKSLSGDQAAARHRAMGPVPAQSRRTRSRPADQGAARGRVRRRSAPTRTCSSTIAASGARLAPMLGGDRRRLELAYSLMCTLPGTPVIRYGDEIGMGDNLDLPERNCARTPMQWSTEPHAGFTESDKPCSPVIDKGPYGYEHVNAAKQRRDPNSMLNWTERIIRMRKEVPEVGWGDFKVIAARDPAVLVDPL